MNTPPFPNRGPNRNLNRESPEAVPDFFECLSASNFSFLRGASHPEELVVAAARQGLGGLALCDRNSVAGVVRAHMAAREAGLRFQPGARLVFADDTPDIAALPRCLEGWNNLCELLSAGNLRATKGECLLRIGDLAQHLAGLALILLPDLPLDSESMAACEQAAGRLQEAAAQLDPGNGNGNGNGSNCTSLHIALRPSFSATDDADRMAVSTLAARTGLPLIATNDVLYHDASRRRLQDVVTCIREHRKIAEAGRLLAPNAERHIKSPQEMARLLAACPGAVAESRRLFESLTFSLDELRYQYPDETPGNGLSQHEELARLAREGARRRYPPETFPGGPPERVLRQIDHELGIIAELEYAPYFLTVHDIVRFARSRGILCQGRGSAANSTLCYCLGITDVDPAVADLLFERFISPERREPPDIDVDFEHERREEVIQYIYGRYGRAHSALAATVITYRARSAVREIGRVFGLSEDAIAGLSGSVWGQSSGRVGEREARQGGLDPADRQLAKVLELANEISGFPRHLSQHVGGFVITRDRLDRVIPLMNTAMENRTQVEWDKDDLESLGILKIDILALGMLTCLRKAFGLLGDHYGLPLSLATMEKEDPRTYAMIQRADTTGVFQIESRAQMSMLPRLKPREFYDLVIEVAIVRPGPIQGDMVHPYLRRRQGIESITYPSHELESVLGRTLGVPLFQEQAMKIAIVAAGFSPGEADRLRRAMATFRRVGTIHSFQAKMVEGMALRGYDRDFAERCFRQIEGFGEYGFPESHAASFALLVYASCWLKCHYPDVFAAAIINSQPMGFYAPSQLVRDAREHGIEIRPPDINWSDHDCTLEPCQWNSERLHPRHSDMAGDIRAAHAVRLGLRLVKGLGREEAEQIMACRKSGYSGIREMWQRTGLSRKALERLAEADAFGSIGLTRREALWQIRGLDPARDDGMPLFAGTRAWLALDNEPAVHLPAMAAGEEVIHDYRSLSLSLRAHPVSFLRGGLTARRMVTSAMLDGMANGRWTEVAGLVVVRQRPGSAKGVVFMTLEDETGIINVIVWPAVFERYRAIVMSSRLVSVRGKVQKADGVIHLVAERLCDETGLLWQLTGQDLPVRGTGASRDPGIDTLANADEVRRPIEDVRQLKSARGNTRRLLWEGEGDQRHNAGAKQPGPHPAGAEAAEDSGRPVPGRAASKISSAMPRGRNFH